jgi:hypothetical protein
MAFYGRVTNDSKTSMTFDKVYPNRLTMNVNANSDGIFNNRFVLGEYGPDRPDSPMDYVMAPDPNVQAYLGNKGSAILSQYNEYFNNLSPEDYYNANYQIDKLEYEKLGRGYDGTVWRKVISDEGQGYYVMLAELNSVVPTFSLKPIAPSETPFPPTFDEDSSNVLYNLLIGSQWGLKTSGNIEINSHALLPLNFDNYAATHSGRDSLSPSSNTVSFVGESSGNQYWDPETNQWASATDQKVLHMDLPVVGGAVSKIWDILYGDLETWRSKDGNLTTSSTRPNSYRPMWGMGSTYGLRLVEDGDDNNVIYTPDHMNNVAGAMNTVFDLIGQNIERIQTDPEDPLTGAETAKHTSFDKIYYFHNEDTNSDTFYYKDYKYEYETITGLDANDPNDVQLLKSGSAPKQYTGTVMPQSEGLYTKSLQTLSQPRSERYKQVGRTQTLQPDVQYYTLTSTYTGQFTAPITIEKNSFSTLTALGLLYELTGEVNSGLTLTPVTTTSTFDATKTYYKVEATPKEYVPYLPEDSASTSHYNGRGVFVNKDRDVINGYPMAAMNSVGAPYHLFYILIPNQEPTHPIKEDGTIDWSITIYTTRLELKAISSTLVNNTVMFNELSQQNPGLIALANNPHGVIYKWPNMLPSGNNPQDQIIGNSARTDNAYCWVRNRNGQLIWSQTPPNLTKLNTAERADELLGLLPETDAPRPEYFHVVMTPVAEFYEPYTYYWGKEGTTYYRKSTDDDDNNLTYKVVQSNGDYLSAGQIEATHYPGVNGHGGFEATDLDDTVYFVPNQLWTLNNDGIHYSLADTFNQTIADNHGYYKQCKLVVTNDPLNEFHRGEEWNTELDYFAINAARRAELGNGFDLEVGWRNAIPWLFKLEDYARTANTMNGWLIKWNQLAGRSDDADIRDTNTLQGLINLLTDRVKNFSNLQPNALFATDMYGHLNAVALGNGTGNDAWLTLNTVVTASGLPVVTVTHASPGTTAQTVNQSTAVASISSLGTNNTFIVPSIGIDSKGHVSTLSGVKLQMPTVPDNYLNTHKLTVSTASPSNPSAGDIWIQIQ